MQLPLELLNGVQLVYCFYVGRHWHDVSDGSTLQMVSAAEMVRDVYKGENYKNMECSTEQSEAFS